MTNSLWHIELELAPEPEHPFGNRDHVYHLYLPLGPDGVVDEASLKRGFGKCRVRRLRPGEGEARGEIALDPEGQLVLQYDADPEPREVGFRCVANRFMVGHAVPIAEENGTAHLFDVIAIRRDRAA